MRSLIMTILTDYADMVLAIVIREGSNPGQQVHAAHDYPLGRHKFVL